MNPPSTIPPADDHLQDAARQFMSASAALASVVEEAASRLDHLQQAQTTMTGTLSSLGMRIEKVDTRVDHLEKTEGGTNATLTSLYGRLSASEADLKTIKEKPADNSKWIERGVSIVALLISLASAYFAIVYGRATIDDSKKTITREENTTSDSALNGFSILLTQLDEAQTQAKALNGQPPPAGAISPRRKYDTLIPQVDSYRIHHDFDAIGQANFSDLMGTVFYFHDKGKAEELWKSVDSVKAFGVDEKRELAMTHAAYATLLGNREEMNKAVARMDDKIYSDLDPLSTVKAHLTFAEMYGTLADTDDVSLKIEHREADAAFRVLANQRNNTADFGKDFDTRVAQLRSTLQKQDEQQRQRMAQAEEERKKKLQTPTTKSTTSAPPTGPTNKN